MKNLPRTPRQAPLLQRRSKQNHVQSSNKNPPSPKRLKLAHMTASSYWQGPLRVLAFGILFCACTVSAAADEPSSNTESSSTEGLSAEAFLASPFAEFFKAGDYARALEALDALAQDYPDDPLITRYRAIVLDRLGRYDEAIEIFKELLARDPDHVPTHFFLGQTYSHQGNTKAAMNEWEWVVERSPEEAYRQWAQEGLDVLAGLPPETIERRRLYVFGTTGAEYDSNPLLQPDDKELAVPDDDKQAARFVVNVGLGYAAILRPDFRFDVISTTRQSWHSEGLDQINFTSQALALDARKSTSLWDRDVIFGARYELAAGFLDEELFALDHELLLSSDMRLTPKTRTYVYNRATLSEFGPDGSNPPQTSRDGFYDDLGLIQYFYTADFQRYLFIGQEVNFAQPRGANFTRRGISSRLGGHTPVPLLPQTDLDASIGVQFGRYPRFSPLSSLDPDRREDATWDVYSALTHYWTPRLATRLFYQYINANNQNDLFEYERHVAGVHLLFVQYF